MCVQCNDVGPPPDSILTLPPPPLPAFLLPKTALAALAHNDSQPCYAAYMCESNLGFRDQSGIEFIDLPGKNDAWIYIIIALLIGIVLLIIVLTFMILKCREDNTQKHAPPKSMCHEPHVSMEKSQSFMPGNILYPCQSNDQHQSLQQELNKENRLLWATLTPHGTRHVIASGSEPYRNYEDHYEIVDYHNKPPVRTRETRLHEPLRKFPNKSFDNSGFSDFDYEDMHLTNAAELYHDENDSGYQEPIEVIGTLNRNPNFNAARFMVSTPTPFENPKIPPLNAYPHRPHNSGTLNKKATLSRRTNEMLNYYGQGSNI